MRVNVGIAYESDLDLAEELTLQVARELIISHPKAIKDFDPKLLYNELADSSINYSIVIKVEDHNARREIRHQIIKDLIKIYHENNINIPL